MSKQNNKTKQGFTIIEVVLVLAIAGLIFLMVFIALPALQRSQRDTQRRDDMARFLSQVNQFQANNAGNTPNTKAAAAGANVKDAYDAFITDYLEVGGDSFNDPSTGSKYQIEAVTDCNTACNQESTGDDVGIMHVYYNAKCDGEDPAKVTGNRKIAITINLEGAGIYCGNN